ncbi:MAG: GntR family transcriptional regulator [Candidatus Limnocylindrales bacterium]
MATRGAISDLANEPIRSTRQNPVVSSVPLGPVLDLRTIKRVVYEALRDQIVWLEMRPGERLVESELGTRMGVSKTPIREALALLEADGLVEAIPYRGAIVRWLTVAEMEEQAFLVDALEIPAFPLVVEHISNAELKAIGRLIEHLKRARRAEDYTRFGQLTLEMHTRLFSVTGMPRLRRLISTVVGPVGLRYDRVLVYAFDDAWDLYMQLTTGRFEAIRDRDPDAAAEVVRRLRGQLAVLGLSRVDDPQVAPFFEAG